MSSGTDADLSQEDRTVLAVMGELEDAHDDPTLSQVMGELPGSVDDGPADLIDRYDTFVETGLLAPSPGDRRTIHVTDTGREYLENGAGVDVSVPESRGDDTAAPAGGDAAGQAQSPSPTPDRLRRTRGLPRTEKEWGADEPVIPVSLETLPDADPGDDIVTPAAVDRIGDAVADAYDAPGVDHEDDYLAAVNDRLEEYTVARPASGAWDAEHWELDAGVATVTVPVDERRQVAGMLEEGGVEDYLFLVDPQDRVVGYLPRGEQTTTYDPA